MTTVRLRSDAEVEADARIRAVVNDIRATRKSDILIKGPGRSGREPTGCPARLPDPRACRSRRQPTDDRVQLVGGDTRRVIPVHEEALASNDPGRGTSDGLRIIELALADGDIGLVA